MAERLDIALAQGFGAGGLDLATRPLRDTAPEDVVLAAGIDADHRPHQMIVRSNRHIRPPNDIEDGQIRSVVELLHLGAARFAKTGDDAGRIGDSTLDHLASCFVGRVGADRCAAILDKAVEIEHGFPPQ